MRELELKDLAPYLPCELTWTLQELKTFTMSGITSDKLYADGLVFNWVKHPDLPQALFPILRPLSDLTIEKLQEYFVGLDIDLVETKQQLIINYSMYNEWKEERINLVTVNMFGHEDRYLPMSASFYLWLIKNHFDINGLIDAGLAVDINTIAKSTEKA